jgi:hypothetical protein
MLQIDFDPVSNREDWTDDCAVRDEANVLVDLSAAIIVLTVRDKQSQSAVLVAKTADSTITVTGTGIFEWTFTEAQMRTVPVPREYNIGCTLKLNGTTRQLFVGTINVLDGIVP